MSFVEFLKGVYEAYADMKKAGSQLWRGKNPDYPPLVVNRGHTSWAIPFSKKSNEQSIATMLA